MGGGIQNNIYGKIRFILKKKNTSLYLCAQTSYRRVHEKLFLFGFTTFVYITHVEIKFMIKKTLKSDYTKVLSIKQHKKH